jgi:hypothetical protein
VAGVVPGLAWIRYALVSLLPHAHLQAVQQDLDDWELGVSDRPACKRCSIVLPSARRRALLVFRIPERSLRRIGGMADGGIGLSPII